MNIPPFLKEKPQFNKNEVIRTQTIAKHRIHVERAIGKVRNFLIFNTRIPISSLGTINQLWTVCCLLSNFMHPVLTDEEMINMCCWKKLQCRTEISQELLKAFTLEMLNAVNVWANFCWVCAAGLSEPLPHYSLFLGQLLTPS